MTKTTQDILLRNPLVVSTSERFEAGVDERKTVTQHPKTSFLRRIVGNLTDDSFLDVVTAKGRDVFITTLKGKIEQTRSVMMTEDVIALKISTTPTNVRFLIVVMKNGKVKLLTGSKNTRAIENKEFEYSKSTVPGIKELVASGKTAIKPSIVVDQSNKTILIHAYPGLLTILYWKTKTALSIFHQDTEDRGILDIDFVEGVKGPSEIVYIFCDDSDETFIQHCTYSLHDDPQRKGIHQGIHYQADFKYKQIIPVPKPAYGYLLLATINLTFKHLAEAKQADITHEGINFMTSYKFNSVINKNQVLLVDLNERVVHLSLKYNNEESTGNVFVEQGDVTYLQQNSAIVYMNYLEDGRLLVQNRGRDLNFGKLSKLGANKWTIEIKGEPAINATKTILKLNDKIAGRFILTKSVGGGAQGKIYEVSDRLEKNTPKILKIVEAHAELSYFKEVAALEKCVDVIGVVKLITYFEHSGNYCIVMPHSGEPLDYYLTRNPANCFSPPNIVRIGFALVKAVRDVHAEGFLHKDIHIKNVLIKCPIKHGRAIVTLIDFGTSERYMDEYNQPLSRDPGYTKRDDLARSAALIQRMANIQVKYVNKTVNNQEVVEVDYKNISREHHWIANFSLFIKENELTTDRLLYYFSKDKTGTNPTTEIEYKVVKVDGKLETRII